MGINKKLQEKYIEAFKKIVFGEYFVPPNEGFIADVATAFLLRNSAVLLTGPPGVGKSTLLRLIAYELTGDAESIAVVPCSEDLRPEDFVYDIDIRQKAENAESMAYEFKAKPRPFLTKTFAFLNEVNRLSSRTLNFLLSILAERQTVVKDSALSRVDGIIMMDMNPQYGNLPWAFVDRIRACLFVPALSLGHQLMLFKRKYGQKKHIEDLVEYALKFPAFIEKQELFQIWKDVDKVILPEEYASNILLFLNAFSACKWDLSKIHAAFRLDCSPKACKFSDDCITKQLEHPVLTRSIDHVAKMLKAEAYFAGRNHVVLKEDILPALRRVMLHRVAVKPEFSSRYPSIEEWYGEEAEARIIRLQENWKKAKEAYDELKAAIEKRQEEGAIKILNKFKESTRDIISVRMVEMLEPELEELCEQRFKQVYSRLLLMEKTAYSKEDLEKIESEVFPDRFDKELKNVLKRLRANLTGVLQIKQEEYAKFVGAVAKVDPTIVGLLPFPREYGEEVHVLPDGSKVTIRKEYNNYVVEYACNGSEAAKVLKEWKTSD